jgi:hypothetical protein
LFPRIAKLLRGHMKSLFQHASFHGDVLFISIDAEV